MFGRQKKPKGPRMDHTYPFLPRTQTYPMKAPDPPTEGWWSDPFDPTSLVSQRYHDGVRWTQYVAVRSARMWSSVFEQPPPADA